MFLVSDMQEPRARLQERPEEGVHTVMVWYGLKGDFGYLVTIRELPRV